MLIHLSKPMDFGRKIKTHPEFESQLLYLYAYVQCKEV